MEDRGSLCSWKGSRERKSCRAFYLAAMERDKEVDAMEDSNRRSNAYIGVPPVADAVQIRRPISYPNDRCAPGVGPELPAHFWPVNFVGRVRVGLFPNSGLEKGQGF